MKQDPISKRVRSLQGFSIDKIASAAGQDPEILRLENLDTDLPPPDSAIKATKNAIGQDDFNSYLPFTGSVALKTKLSEVMSKRYKYSIPSEHITITNGATEGMINVLLAIIDHGDEVIVTDPTYAGIIQRIILAGGKPVYIPFRRTEYRWFPDLNQLASLISKKTKAIFLMNPSMPTGNVLTKEEWIRIADLVRRNDLYLIYNAAMERILFDGLSFLHPYMFKDLAERTITIGSVSKEYRMIGWRTGWIIAPSKLVKAFETIHIYNVVSVSGFTQEGVLAALDESEQILEICIKEWQRRRDKISDELSGYSMIPAQGGWSQLLDCSALGLHAELASRLLLEKGGIASTPMTHWGKQVCHNYVRLVFSNEPLERLEGIHDRFKQAFA